ncbi:unnamed protein product, partial [Discosporangium mesarthrocarpum]
MLAPTRPVALTLEGRPSASVAFVPCLFCWLSESQAGVRLWPRNGASRRQAGSRVSCEPCAVAPSSLGRGTHGKGGNGENPRPVKYRGGGEIHIKAAEYNAEGGKKEGKAALDGDRAALTGGNGHEHVEKEGGYVSKETKGVLGSIPCEGANIPTPDQGGHGNGRKGAPESPDVELSLKESEKLERPTTTENRSPIRGGGRRRGRGKGR